MAECNETRDDAAMSAGERFTSTLICQDRSEETRISGNVRLYVSEHLKNPWKAAKHAPRLIYQSG